MLMNYDISYSGKRSGIIRMWYLQHKLCPMFPFVHYTTRKGIINNATTMENQKDISVVKLNFHSASSSLVESAGHHGIMCCHLSIKQ